MDKPLLVIPDKTDTGNRWVLVSFSDEWLIDE